MASSTTHTITTLLHDAWERFFAALAHWFEAQMQAGSRRDRIQALEMKTDAELARMGIRRDEIALYVFRDKFYK